MAILSIARALSSWYTPPGGTPAGSVVGDKIRGVNLGGWFILVSILAVVEVQPTDTGIGELDDA